MDSYHIAVMLREAVEGLGIQGDGVYVDVTFGGGGHSREILSHLNQRGVLLAIDQDPAAEQNMIKDPRFSLLSGNFRFIENLVKGEGYDQVHGVLADLGISSHQIDEASRGFAHRWDGPLDMRMNSKEGGSAADWINEATDREMFQVFRTYGEIERPGVLVRAILKERELAPILTTARLRSLAEPLAPRNKKSQFLSKIFQAIRIEVNGGNGGIGRVVEWRTSNAKAWWEVCSNLLSFIGGQDGQAFLSVRKNGWGSAERFLWEVFKSMENDHPESYTAFTRRNRTKTQGQEVQD